MAKSLADMTAEEREECVGMWCEIAGQLEILAEPDGMVDYHDTAILHSVKRNGGGYVLAKDVIPRFDLPRAWTPDGEPVEMVKEYGIFYTLRDGGEEICFVHDDPLSVEPAVKHLEKSLRRGTITKITRKTQWVTEWEEVPEPQRTNGMVNPYV